MQFLSTILLATIVGAASTGDNLGNIDTQTKNLRTTIGQYNGGLSAAVVIHNAAGTLDSAIKNATSDANTAPKMSNTEAQNALNFASKTLEPDVLAAINDLIGKKAQLVKDGVQKIVEDDVLSISNHTKIYSSAVVKLAPNAQASQSAVAILNKIQADVQKGVDAFA